MGDNVDTHGNDRSDVDRSKAVCYGNGCGGEPTHRVRWERGDQWYGICEDCAEDIPITRGSVLEGLKPETITMHPVATDGGTQKTVSEHPPGQVCPNKDCHIDQRWEGFHGLACPECACRLAVACSKCDNPAIVESDNSEPLCDDHYITENK